MASLLAASVLALVASSARAQPNQGAVSTHVPLSIAIVEDAGTPIVSETWLAERVTAANAIYGPSAIEFAVHATRSLDARHADLVTRSDRHALGREMLAHVVNVFVVRSLRDVDGSGYRQGVHWRPAGRPGAHFVIVSRDSGPSTLAHELGHFFGNGHSTTRGNLMSYDRGDGPPFFDATQRRRIAQRLALFLRTGELVAERAVAPRITP